MIFFEDECVDCPKEIGCIGDNCIYKNVPHFCCDECDNETELYEFEGSQLCLECIKRKLKKVEVENAL